MKALQHATLVAMCAIMLLPVLGSSTAARPKIFMYELPEKFHNWTKFGNELKAPGCFYSLDYILPALLRNTSYHTTDANEADFFFVDAW